jgi:hypothetical protein
MARPPFLLRKFAGLSLRIGVMKGWPRLSEMIQNSQNFCFEAIKCFLLVLVRAPLPIPALVSAMSPALAASPALIRGPSDTRAQDCWLSKKPMSDFRFGEDLWELEL